jgi:hypothetical protein
MVQTITEMVKTKITNRLRLNSEAVIRYYMVHGYWSRSLKQLRDRYNIEVSSVHHSSYSPPDLNLLRVRRDEDDVQSVVQLMETCI